MAKTEQRLESLLERIRERYVSGFLFQHDKLTAKYGSITSEGIVRDDDNAIVRHDVFNLPIRSEFTSSGMLIGDGAWNHNAAVPFEPFTHVDSRALDVAVRPFAWNDLLVTMRFQEPSSLAPIRNWYLEWFQDRRMAESPKISGAVHRLLGPRKTGDQAEFRVHLGTAPVEALTEFVQALCALGVAEMTLGSPSRSAI